MAQDERGQATTKSDEKTSLERQARQRRNTQKGLLTEPASYKKTNCNRILVNTKRHRRTDGIDITQVQKGEEKAG